MVDQIGIDVKETRFEKILSVLRIIVDYYEQNKVHELMQQYDEASLFFVLTDATTYIKLFNFFKDKKSHEIPRRKLIESITGPILPWEEVPNKGTAHSRNISFELETAVWFHKSGIEIENFDDVQFLFDNHFFNVQCKRIHSLYRIADNIADAARQISKRMQKGNKMKGVIYLCIDKFTEKEGWILQVNHVDEIGPHLDKLAIDFIRNYSHLWKNLANINILGTAIVVNILASIKQDPFPMLTTCKNTVIDIIPNQGIGQDSDYSLIKNLCVHLGDSRTIKS
ncbi:MAG: hypothetical protein V3U54_11160 [Thermodesulfobacteriota bacterium]